MKTWRKGVHGKESSAVKPVMADPGRGAAQENTFFPVFKSLAKTTRWQPAERC